MTEHDERPFNYLESVANDIWLEVISLEHGDIVPLYPKEDEVLWLGYAVLCLGYGMATTAEQVHDVWSMWCTTVAPEHRSLVPFNDLTPQVQAYDNLYRDAIRNVAAERVGIPF